MSSDMVNKDYQRIGGPGGSGRDKALTIGAVN